MCCTTTAPSRFSMYLQHSSWWAHICCKTVGSASLFPPVEAPAERWNGDVLEIQYEERMQHSDFENAVYQRAQ